MNATDINRRRFLQTGAIAASLAAAGRLPLLAAEPRSASGIDPAGSAHSVKPIRSYLKRFSACDGDLTKAHNYALSYDIIHWSGGTTQVAVPANPVIGTLKVSRQRNRSIGFDSTVDYNVRQTARIGGVDNVIAAQMTCEGGKPDAIFKWSFSRHSTSPDGNVDAISRLDERGRIRMGRIEVENDRFKYGFECTRAVATQWSILGVLTGLKDRNIDLRFDLLQDLSLFKPDQRLICEGDVDVKIADGKTATLTSYCQTGHGILPIHYLRDSRGLVQLVTNAMVSWAITDCATT